jgi:hypothetical protein
MATCQNCGATPLPTRHSRYCSACSAIASVLWKRGHRERWASSDASAALPTWLSEGWASVEEWREYHRTYMSKRRRELRVGASRTHRPSPDTLDDSTINTVRADDSAIEVIEEAADNLARRTTADQSEQERAS